jgi:hypothetical protein
MVFLRLPNLCRAQNLSFSRLLYQLGVVSDVDIIDVLLNTKPNIGHQAAMCS